PTVLATDAANLYWVNDLFSSPTIMRSSKTGGEAIPVAAMGNRPDGQFPPRQIGIDNTHFYFSDGTRILKVSKEGGEPELVTLAPALAGSVTVDEDTVYFTEGHDFNSNLPVRIRKVAKTGGTATLMISQPQEIPQ